MSGPWEKYQGADGPWAKYQSQDSSQEEPSIPFGQTVMNAARDVLSSPARIAQNLTPERLSEHAPVLGAVGGEMLAGPPGAAVGAGGGQIVKRMADVAYGRVPPSDAMNPTSEAVAPMVQAATAGVPGTTEGQAATQAIGKGLRKFGQTITGAKADVLAQAAKQGYSTYLAPSLEKAREVFGAVLGPEGQDALKTKASEAFDPALGAARKIAGEVGEKIESGVPVDSIEALKARQATDRVISSTPFWDKKTKAMLYDWRSKFDDVISSQNGPLKEASSIYRQAVVKDQLLNPTRINKHGEPSALLPMLAGIAGPLAGYQTGHTGKGTMAAVGYMAATSPLTAGFLATTAGAISPTVRTAILSELITRITDGKQRSQ